MDSWRKRLKRVAEWLDHSVNPMLIKELRQGLRTKTFLGAFLAVQGIMQFSMLFAVLSIQSLDDFGMEMANAFFWFTISVPLLLLMPMRGATAISGEVKGNLLELVFLTRLTAWRTVCGKWLALFVQCVLLVIAVLPYSVMRYYLGGVDVLLELFMIALFLVAAAILIALQVAQSAMKGSMLRGLAIMFASLFLLLPYLFGVTSSMGFTSISGGILFYGLLMALLLIVTLLEFGASYVAPLAENHSLRKRILGIVSLGVSLIFSYWTQGNITLGLWIGGPIFFLVLAEALSEPMHTDVALYQKRKGLVGFLENLFFSRGWVSALALALTGFLLLVIASVPGDPQLANYGLLSLGCLLFPVFIVRLFSRNFSFGLPLFILISSMAFLLGSLSYMLEDLTKLKTLHVIAFIPPIYVSNRLVSSESLTAPQYLQQLWIGTAVMVCFLLFRAIQVVRQLRKTNSAEVRVTEPAAEVC